MLKRNKKELKIKEYKQEIARQLQFDIGSYRMKIEGLKQNKTEKEIEELSYKLAEKLENYQEELNNEIEDLKNNKFSENLIDYVYNNIRGEKAKEIALNTLEEIFKDNYYNALAFTPIKYDTVYYNNTELEDSKILGQTLYYLIEYEISLNNDIEELKGKAISFIEENLMYLFSEVLMPDEEWEKIEEKVAINTEYFATRYIDPYYCY